MTVNQLVILIICSLQELHFKCNIDRLKVKGWKKGVPWKPQSEEIWYSYINIWQCRLQNRSITKDKERLSQW